MEKYKAMFWSLLLGLFTGILFLIGIGFLTLSIGDAATVVAVAAAAVVAAVAAVAVAAVVAAVAAAVVVAAIVAVVAAAANIPTGMLFLTAMVVTGIGCLVICHKFKEKNTTIVATFATVAGVILIGFVPAVKTAYVQLIPKDQRIIRSLERKELIFTLPMNQEKYLKEFFFLRQKDGGLISFRDGKFELEKTIHRFALPDGSVKNERKEILTVSFDLDKIDPTTIEGLIIQHPFAPLTEIPLETIGKQ